MKILIACEFSGTVRNAFESLGHDAWSCDILPSEGKHIQDDVLNHLDGWDLIIAHPPCTYLANSGVCWLHRDPGRWAKLDDGVEFFAKLYHAPCDRVAVENPVIHKHARERLAARNVPHFTQSIQPWQFGHGESKRTCLWLRGLPALKPTEIVPGREQRLHKLPPSKDRWMLRSKTYDGIAAAMAAQWSVH